MRVLRILLGAALVPATLAVLWVAGILDPPETVRRRLVAFAAFTAFQVRECGHDIETLHHINATLGSTFGG